MGIGDEHRPASLARGRHQYAAGACRIRLGQGDDRARRICAWLNRAASIRRWHRILVIGAGTRDRRPQNGALVTLLVACGSTRGERAERLFPHGVIDAIHAVVAAAQQIRADVPEVGNTEQRASDPGGFRVWWRALTGSDETLENTYLMRVPLQSSCSRLPKAHGIPSSRRPRPSSIQPSPSASPSAHDPRTRKYWARARQSVMVGLIFSII